jgi:integrase
MGFRMYLWKHPSGTYYYRRRLNADNARLLGKDVFKKSLKTKDRFAALVQQTVVEFEFNAIVKGELHLLRSLPLPQRKTKETKVNISMPNHPHKLSEALTDWSTNSHIAERTKMDWNTAVKRFIELHDDLEITAITRSHGKQFRDALKALPNANKLTGHLRTKTLPELVQLRKQGELTLPPLSNTTVNKYLTAISSIINKSINEYDLDFKNPFTNLNLDKEEKERLPYSLDELKIFFAATPYDRANDKDHCFWLPLLALFTGARLEELGQCVVDDVKPDASGFWYLDINKRHSHKKLKNESSKRCIPLHQLIIACGFGEYVEQLKTQKTRMLFPKLNVSKEGRFTKSYSQSFGRHLSKIGLRDEASTENSRLDFHSFRHTFKDACRNADIQPEIHHRLTGHTTSSVGDRYGSGHSLNKLNDAIQKIDYTGLDLSHLHGGRYKVDTDNHAPNTQSASSSDVVIKTVLPPKDFIKWIRLADAYQILGKHMFKDKWNDFEFGINDNNQQRIVCLKEHVRTTCNSYGFHELKPVDNKKLFNTQPATKEQSDQHNQVWKYLSKGLMNQIQAVGQNKANGKYQEVPIEAWSIALDNMDILQSTVSYEGNEWLMLLHPESVIEFAKCV